MNVIVANQYKNELSNLDVDVIKSITGEFDADELVAMFKNFFFDKMILDITAIKNYKNLEVIQKLAMGLSAEKLILIIPDEECSSSAYLSSIISMGIYNFTNNVNAVKVDLEDDGRVIIYHTDQDIIDKTAKMIQDITREVEVGAIYEAKVVKIEDFGCFVEIWPGCEGLVHISQLAEKRVEKTEDVVSLGDEILVKALGPDKKGRQNFSRKEALLENKKTK